MSPRFHFTLVLSVLLQIHSVFAQDTMPTPAAPAMSDADQACIQKVLKDYGVANPEIYYLYDGCTERAQKLLKTIKESCNPSASAAMEQIWLKGKLCYRPRVHWQFHTALCFTDKNGVSQVIDPSMGGIMPKEDWQKRCNLRRAPNVECETTVCGSPPQCLKGALTPQRKSDADARACYFPCYGQGIFEIEECLRKADKSTFSEETAVKCTERGLMSCTKCALKCNTLQDLRPPYLTVMRTLVDDEKVPDPDVRKAINESFSACSENTEYYDMSLIPVQPKAPANAEPEGLKAPKNDGVEDDYLETLGELIEEVLLAQSIQNADLNPEEKENLMLWGEGECTAPASEPQSTAAYFQSIAN